MSNAPPIGYLQLLRENRQFRLLWLAQIVSQLGDWMYQIVFQVMLLELTDGSPLAVAGHAIAMLLPGFLVGPVAGVVVDRLPRKQVMIAADVARGVLALGFLLVRSSETVWIGYAVAAGISTFSVFFEPARNSIIPNIASERELVTANALGAVTWSILLTGGAFFGGVIAYYFGAKVAFLLDSLSFFISAVVLARLQALPAAETSANRGFSDLIDGIRYVMWQRSVGRVLIVKTILGLSNGVFVLTPIFGKEVFPLAGAGGHEAGALSTSILMAAGGAGTALGPIIGRRIAGSDPSRMRRCIAAAFIWSGVTYWLCGYSPNLAVLTVLLFLNRHGGSLAWVFSTILLQMETENRFRGRVFAAEMGLFTVSMMASSVATAQAMERWTLSPFLMIQSMGVIVLSLGGVWPLTGLRGRLHADARAAEPPPPGDA